VFGRGGEEALALAMAGITCEIVPGVTTAVAAAELAGIPVTHRGVASAFLVLAGHNTEAIDNTLQSVRPNTVSLVIMMGIGAREELAARLMSHGWNSDVPAAIVCAASTPDEWMWTGTLAALGAAPAPEGAAGVLVVGEVVRVRDALAAAKARPVAATDEVKYGRH
jgi:siroheme synthase